MQKLQFLHLIKNPNQTIKLFSLFVLTLIFSISGYGQQTFGNPVNGNAQVSCYFHSQCAHSDPNYQHTALDYGSSNGLTIKATADGKVSKIEYMNANDHGMGTNIIIQHRMSNGNIRYSSYSHLANITSGISVGTVVSQGQTIGTMGGSGYGNASHWGVHLHFEIKNGNVSHNPSGSGNHWGYTPGNPLNWGYWNPIHYLGVQTVIPQPDISSPSNGSNNIPISSTLDWNSVSGATNYRIQVKKGNSSGWSAENGFTSGSGTTSSIVVNSTTGTSSQANVTLEPNTTYYWTVRVANSSSHSFYSNVKSFTTSNAATSNPCNEYSSVSASPSSTTASLSINGMSSNATNTAYIYKAANASSWNGWYAANGANISLNNLTPNTQYDYRIAVYCSALGWNISSVQSFNTTGSNSGGSNSGGSAICNEYSSVSASPSSTTASLSINGMSSNASNIAYLYKAVNASSWNGWYAANGANINLNNLTPGTQYDYRIAVYCSALGWNISSVQSFNTTGSNSGGSNSGGSNSGSNGSGSTANGCSGGGQYPAHVLTPSNSWQYEDCLFAGEYAKFSVSSGQTYSFSTCSAHGAGANYDTELTLMNNSGGILAFNDDNCNLQSTITWTSNFNGYIRVLVTKYQCETNSTCTKLGYKKGSANLTGGNSNGRMASNTDKVNKAEKHSIHNLPVIESSSNTIPINLNSLTEELDLKLYPNPTANFVNLDLDIAGKDGVPVFIEIFNAQGALIRKIQGEVENESLTKRIDVSDMSDGFYLISLTINKRKITERFVISKK